MNKPKKGETKTMRLITIRANAVHDNGDGTFAIEVINRVVTQQESELLNGLFPDLGSAIDVLLAKQALIISVV